MRRDLDLQGGRRSFERNVMLQTLQGGIVSGGRDVFVTDSACGKKVVRERRDVTDSGRGKGVVRERRDVTDSGRGKRSYGRDVMLHTVQWRNGWLGRDVMLLSVKGRKESFGRDLIL